ncbi:MAG: GNAT family N-acetyltransferase [Actinomycetota bacterium]|nr:GNAT family N-acetyltransferase [Actinomycetota bacterium]
MSFLADERNTPPARRRAPFMLLGDEVSCRVQQWSFQAETAQLVMYQQRRLPSGDDLQRWAHELAELGYTRLRTSAVTGHAATRMESAGFTVLQELLLLEHTAPRDAVATAGSAARRRAEATRRLLVHEHRRASMVDTAAFGQPWSLDEVAIHDVCSATPRHRARGGGDPLAAYAITGRDGRQGFLQRLAVHPDAQRRGLGAALVLDALRWSARWRVERVLVNTPTDNVAALALYEGFGFRRLPDRLRVYERELR